ncbi:MAG: winged helix DNA-binding domain-containing protein [Actinomycetota bacterium]|nr:winged helix DNA-binding domain-containing protein [Actinomycetota bacterium]
MQAQDHRAARLGVRARSKGLTADDVERERIEDRSFVRTWVMRGTIHLIATEDLPWIRDLVAPPLIAQAYLRMKQEGLPRERVDPARRHLRKLLADGPLTRAEIREGLARKGIRPRGRQGVVQLLFLMTVEGELVTGPERGGKETVVLLRDWLPKKQPRPPRDPAAELGRRYLAGYGPATLEDFRMWSSVRAGIARAGWEAISEELVEEDGLWHLRSQRARPIRTTSPRFLPAWDHYYLGYRERSHVGASANVTISRGGLYDPFVVVDGRAVANWRLRKNALEVLPFRGATRPARKALEREVADIGRFLGTPVDLARV